MPDGSAAGPAVFVAAALPPLLPCDTLMSRGWRVPFVFGLLIGPLGFYLRRLFDDTLHQTVAAADACGAAAKKSAAAAGSAEAAVPLAAAACAPATLRRAARMLWRQIVAGTLLVIGGTSTMYTIVFSCLCSCS